LRAGHFNLGVARAKNPTAAKKRSRKMDSYMGLIYIWPIRYAPQDFTACNGVTLSLQQYQALYALLGTTYGGNGNPNFNLPNLANRFPFGSSQLGGGASGAPNLQNGQTGGTLALTMPVTVSGTLSLPHLPGHTHPASFAATTGNASVTVSAPPAAIPVTIPVGTTAQSAAPPATLTGNVSLTNSVMTGVGGTSFRGPFSSTAPTATVNLAGATVSGNPGGSFTGNVSTVTGGTVAVTSQNTNAPAPLTSTGTVPLPPYLALSFIMCTTGTWPVQP
jgi:microcystin-dependent protein